MKKKKGMKGGKAVEDARARQTQSQTIELQVKNETKKERSRKIN